MNSERTTCPDGRCDCSGLLPRRDFLKLTGLAAAAAAVADGMPVMAGPFENENEYLQSIPQDKRLDPDWLRSLYERGEKETYRDPAALRHIGMPVGGLFAGTVYLGGDGRLWLWDIFNRDQEGIAPRSVPHQGQQVPTRNGANYIQPAAPQSPFEIGFALRVGERLLPLDASGFADIAFDGRYPAGRISYRDDSLPVAVRLEAFSPFIPLNVEDSSLPVTVMSFTVENVSSQTVEYQLAGHLENAIALYHRDRPGKRINRVVIEPGLTRLDCLAAAVAAAKTTEREEIVFADFETAEYTGWTAEGEAFGSGPIAMKDIPEYQGDVGGRGQRVVNSHASAPGSGVLEKDSRLGTLTSDPFTIERNFINFLIGGGGHAGKTCMNLIVDDRVVASATGRSNNRMGPNSFPTAHLQGKTARLQIVDQVPGAWGNIGVDHIVFSDRSTDPSSDTPLAELHDFGTMSLALFDSGEHVAASASQLGESDDPQTASSAETGLADKLVGSLAARRSIEPGQSQTVTFLVAWHFPNFHSRGAGSGPDGNRVGHSYAARFADAEAVVRYVAGDFERLAGTTRRWVDTWYDSTLPYWLLDRTMANTSTLATTTCYRFEDGRFWAWEGIGCCPGTCTHVWHYAQAPGRLFPEIEREHRRRVDFGLALHADGGVGMRAGMTGANEPAHDGQCGRILGVYREHQMSPDDAFLREIWPNVKSALQYMIRQDGDGDGMIEGAQPNTLDAAWFGKISFLGSLYLAALRAGEAMAAEVGDQEFARQCRTITERGAESILQLYDGEYFIQIEDPQRREAIGVGSGCYIDQVFGQTWAHWVGLGTLFDRDKQLSALRALWKYNFVPDIGPFRERFERGRWYALAGDAGLLMCTWPKGGQNPNFHKHWQYMYFNECMTGFEWQAAAHMVWEGLDHPDILQQGLAVSRAIHDRYNARLRNPYNEIECSDHYSRAMASFGVYQAVCGWQCHGPKGHLEFAPRIRPDDFRAAFTAASGWGSFRQQRAADRHLAEIEVREGAISLHTVTLALRDGFEPRHVSAQIGDRAVASAFQVEGGTIRIELAERIDLACGERLALLAT
jgi:non-lysosomal glucosylceramidase